MRTYELSTYISAQVICSKIQSKIILQGDTQRIGITTMTMLLLTLHESCLSPSIFPWSSHVSLYKTQHITHGKRFYDIIMIREKSNSTLANFHTCLQQWHKDHAQCISSQGNQSDEDNTVQLLQSVCTLHLERSPMCPVTSLHLVISLKTRIY